MFFHFSLQSATREREEKNNYIIYFRYLATGCPFRALALYFARGECTISRVIAETTQVIWNALKETYMPVPTTDEWKRIARRYFELWNLPNCLGAIDGKHIRIQKFPNTGSANFNYKGYHSIILLGCCDVDGYFITVECGFAGRNSEKRRCIPCVSFRAMVRKKRSEYSYYITIALR